MSFDLLVVVTKAVDKESNVVSANRPGLKITNLACLVTMYRNIIDRTFTINQENRVMSVKHSREASP